MATQMPEWQPQYSYSPLPEPAGAFTPHQSAPQLVNEDDTTKEARSASSVNPGLTPQHGWMSSAPRTTPSPTSTSEGKRPVPFPASSAHDEPGSRKTAVLMLSILVGILAAAVIGLAAATGVMAKRVSDAESLNAQLGLVETCPPPTTTTTTTTTTATALGSPITVAVDDITNGCAAENEKISGTTYTTELYGKVTFARYCNLETRHFPFYALAAASFEACLDACAAWSQVGPNLMGADNINATCAGAHFVPLWSNKTEALRRNARGNCFLKPGPQSRGALKSPSMGTTCHSGIVVSLTEG
ncbi:hypothetical protein MMYC01_200863 [Madurella mycetomatis]|uniref:Uncharacterized protein n=1 Tax=Madurella mycetomatis TaxID=100816 RepID=A0A175WGR1_9PEZI|nr:hypothetical protein MMYC01_205104 [Madurella mycetomatis]KXX82721.1 hypothetical protein MMYC01_200863 [Madurella mycetomatis]